MHALGNLVAFRHPIPRSLCSLCKPEGQNFNAITISIIVAILLKVYQLNSELRIFYMHVLAEKGVIQHFKERSPIAFDLNKNFRNCTVFAVYNL